jgi:NhaA family Na+:H+ antiporter
MNCTHVWQRFLGGNVNAEVGAAVALLGAAVAALLVVNLGGAQGYGAMLATKVTLGVGELALSKTLLHWVNDGLMALFFVVIGIEIRREMTTGSLQTPRRAVVPMVAAVCGFAVPAVIYLSVVGGEAGLGRGWSIPAATDIAFAVALLTVLRRWVPASLRAFLLVVAVTDDLLAIGVIAVFYTTELLWLNLLLAGVVVLMLLGKQLLARQRMWVLAVLGLLLWLCVVHSGVHATVAGAVFGFLLPVRGVNASPAPAETLEHALLPWVRWLIVPLFAFANIGVDLRGLSLETLLTPVTMGIALGLLVGKPLGIVGAVWALERFAGLPRPSGASWRQVLGVGCVCGIGFTMSLLIGALALGAEHQDAVRLGVLLGSVGAAGLAVGVLYCPKKRIS